jgi:hypothetical protein
MTTEVEIAGLEQRFLCIMIRKEGPCSEQSA